MFLRSLERPPVSLSLRGWVWWRSAIRGCHWWGMASRARSVPPPSPSCRSPCRPCSGSLRRSSGRWRSTWCGPHRRWQVRTRWRAAGRGGSWRTARSAARCWPWCLWGRPSAPSPTSVAVTWRRAWRSAHSPHTRGSSPASWRWRGACPSAGRCTAAAGRERGGSRGRRCARPATGPGTCRHAGGAGWRGAASSPPDDSSPPPAADRPSSARTSGTAEHGGGSPPQSPSAPAPTTTAPRRATAGARCRWRAQRTGAAPLTGHAPDTSTPAPTRPSARSRPSCRQAPSRTTRRAGGGSTWWRTGTRRGTPPSAVASGWCACRRSAYTHTAGRTRCTCRRAWAAAVCWLGAAGRGSRRWTWGTHWTPRHTPRPQTARLPATCVRHSDAL